MYRSEYYCNFLCNIKKGGRVDATLLKTLSVEWVTVIIDVLKSSLQIIANEKNSDQRWTVSVI